MSDATADSQRLLQPSAPTAFVVLALLLVVNVPLFLCMPLTDDTTLYDLQALNLMQGGVLYHDIFEPNLPGVVWLHVAVRTLLGVSSIAMRAADLAFFAMVVWLLAGWVRTMGRSTATQAWLAAVLCLFYFSISEWCHCQRDLWMLMPGLTALHLRRRQAERLRAGGTTNRSTVRWAFLEGSLWALAVWIKPLIMIPAMACWVVSAIWLRSRKVLVDLAGLMMGGIAIGAMGTLWLAWSGALPAFYETWTEWNPRYFSSRRDHWTIMRFAGMTYRLSPWIFLHLVAVPLAIGMLLTNVRRRFDDGVECGRVGSLAQSLLAVLYLGWMVQSFFLQHLFDYVHVPSLLLAMTLLAAAPRLLVDRREWQLAVVGFLGFATLASPILHSDRLGCWATCVNEGSTPAVRNQLSHFDHPNWEDLHQVAEYLRAQGTADGELTCFNNNLISLYSALQLRPSSRYVYLETLAVFFPERRKLIFRELAETDQRFLVTDLSATGLPPALQQGIVPGKPLPEDFPQTLKEQLPFASPIVFRVGDIVVHRCDDPTAKASRGSVAFAELRR